jgi:ribonuclease E
MGRRRRGGGAQRVIGRKLLINARESEESRIAVLEAGRLEEYYIERGSLGSTLGNIYKARVTNVESSIGAAFVEFGHSRQGFLHVSDLCMAAVGENQRALLASVQQAREDAHDEDVIDIVLRSGGEAAAAAPAAGAPAAPPADASSGEADEDETDELDADAPGYASAPEVIEPGSAADVDGADDGEGETNGELAEPDAVTERKSESVAFAKGDEWEAAPAAVERAEGDAADEGEEDDEGEDEGELDEGEPDGAALGAAEPGTDGAGAAPATDGASAGTADERGRRGGRGGRRRRRGRRGGGRLPTARAAARDAAHPGHPAEGAGDRGPGHQGRHRDQGPHAHDLPLDPRPLRRAHAGHRQARRVAQGHARSPSASGSRPSCASWPCPRAWASSCARRHRRLEGGPAARPGLPAPAVGPDPQSRIKEHSAPVLLYQENDLVIRTLRDLYDGQGDVIIDDRGTVEKARQFMREIMPVCVDKVQLYDGDRPLFNFYNVEDEITRLLENRIELKSGGSLIIEQTEALVAIDVNSGRFKSEPGKGNRRHGLHGEQRGGRRDRAADPAARPGRRGRDRLHRHAQREAPQGAGELLQGGAAARPGAHQGRRASRPSASSS